jgi:hypothetical protein
VFRTAALLEKQGGYNAGLVSLDLAILSIQEGRAAELKSAGRSEKLGEDLPQAGEPFPEIGRRFPDFGEPSPQIGEDAPQFGQPFPNLREPLPNVGRLFPHSLHLL